MAAPMERVEFYKHDLGEAEIASVADTLRSLFLTLGHGWGPSSAPSGNFWGCRT